MEPMKLQSTSWSPRCAFNPAPAMCAVHTVHTMCNSTAPSAVICEPNVRHALCDSVNAFDPGVCH